MNRGYVKLWRKIEDIGLLQNPTAWQIFGWLLIKATRTKWRKSIRGQVFDLMPGEYATSVSAICDALNITSKQCRVALKFLEKLEIVASKTTNKGSVFSLINWERYQNSEDDEGQAEWQAEGKQRASRGQAKGKPLIKQELKNERIKEDINTLSECLSPLRADDSPAVGILPRDLPTEQEQLSLTETTDSAIANTSEQEKTPSCPYQEIIDLYHTNLPEHPKVALLNESRRRTMKARWADVGKRLKAQGKPYGRDERLHYFTLLFGRASKSDFLCGRITGSNGRPYIVNFDKLMSPSGFIGIIEGKYDNR